MPGRLDELLQGRRGASPQAAIFVEEDGRSFTVGQFDRLVTAAARWLDGRGIRAGDRVAVWLVNRIEWLALIFAAARRGVVLVAVNTRYRSVELHHVLLASGARLLIMEPHFRQIDFGAVLEGVEPRDLLELETVAVLGPAPARLLDRPTVGFEIDMPAPAEPGRPDDASDPESPLLLFTTSGTTKAPKLVIHPQRTITRHARQAAAAVGLDEPGAALLAALPFCGVFGLDATLAAVAGGAPVHIVPTFDAASAAERIRSRRLTHLFGSDEMVHRLLGQGAERLGSLRLCGFAAFTPGLAQLLEAAAEGGLPLRGLYGSSELQALFAIQPGEFPTTERLRAGGRPVAGAAASLRVRDEATGELLGPGVTGELEIRAPSGFIGYFRNPEATHEAVDPEGFFRTGDVGYLRPDGTFVFLTRSGDAMRLAGFLVDPAEIEEVLEAAPAVGRAQVVAADLDGQWRAVAFVVPAGGGLEIDEALLLDWVAARLAPFKVPARIFALPAFPTTDSANGRKIQKSRLRELATERLAAPVSDRAGDRGPSS